MGLRWGLTLTKSLETPSQVQPFHNIKEPMNLPSMEKKKTADMVKNLGGP